MRPAGGAADYSAKPASSGGGLGRRSCCRRRFPLSRRQFQDQSRRMESKRAADDIAQVDEGIDLAGACRSDDSEHRMAVPVRCRFTAREIDQYFRPNTIGQQRLLRAIVVDFEAPVFGVTGQGGPIAQCVAGSRTGADSSVTPPPAAPADTLAVSPATAAPCSCRRPCRAGASSCRSLATRSIPYSCLISANACAQATAAVWQRLREIAASGAPRSRLR